jgi:hypothetical protein
MMLGIPWDAAVRGPRSSVHKRMCTLRRLRRRGVRASGLLRDGAGHPSRVCSGIPYERPEGCRAANAEVVCSTPASPAVRRPASITLAEDRTKTVGPTVTVGPGVLLDHQVQAFWNAVMATATPRELFVL